MKELFDEKEELRRQVAFLNMSLKGYKAGMEQVEKQLAEVRTENKILSKKLEIQYEANMVLIQKNEELKSQLKETEK